MDIPTTSHRQHPCHICGKTYSTSSNLSRHKRKHIDEVKYVCYICQKNYRWFSNLKAHIRNHNGLQFTCKICNVKFDTYKSYKEHKFSHDETKEVSCDICQKKYKTSSGLATHRRKTHPGKKEYLCKFCGLTFVFKRTLRQHMSGHTDIDNLICEYCGYTFSFEQDFRQHLQTHSGERQYVCVTCGTTFEIHSAFWAHKQVHEFVYTCFKCLRTFEQKQNATFHVMSCGEQESAERYEDQPTTSQQS